MNRQKNETRPSPKKIGYSTGENVSNTFATIYLADTMSAVSFDFGSVRSSRHVHPVKCRNIPSKHSFNFENVVNVSIPSPKRRKIVVVVSVA